MIYSSGTTGKPKGILLSHHGIVRNAELAASVLKFQADDRFLSMLPSFSSFGFSFDFMQAGLVGATTAVLPRFDPEEALNRIERFRITCLVGVPTMFARLFDEKVVAGRDLSSLRLLDVGGGPVSDRLKRDLANFYGIEMVESYGLTEISPVACAQVPGGRIKGSSCGPPLPGITAKIVDAEGREQPRGTLGELIFRGDTMMLGYWNQPEQTARSLRDGWLYSGDIAEIDADGEIHIRDRLKDMIVTNGFNVYPKEVENAVCELDAVETCAVTGVPHPIRGEDVAVFVVLRPGRSLTEADILRHCERNVAKFKVPKIVRFIADLPLTASGKIQRFRLREIVAESAQAAGSR